MSDTPQPAAAEPAAPVEEQTAAEKPAQAGESVPEVTAEVQDPPTEAGAVVESAFAHRLELILEALLLAADAPLPLEQMQKLLAAEFSVSRKDLRAALEQLDARYTGSACELREVGSGWRLQVRPEYGEWVGRLWQEKPPKYSRALLETLALIVYRQPITRGEIEDVRGVAVSTNILRTLLERGWVREVGHKEVPGRPALYGTAPQFLDDFNLKSLDQLPALPEIKDLDQLEAALQRLGQGTEALASLRAEQAAAEQPIQSGAEPEGEDTATAADEPVDEQAEDASPEDAAPSDPAFH
jgi:segregation and condensation protein B